MHPYIYNCWFWKNIIWCLWELISKASDLVQVIRDDFPEDIDSELRWEYEVAISWKVRFSKETFISSSKQINTPDNSRLGKKRGLLECII